MPPNTVKNSLALGETIKNRRTELNLTIEEAALKAGIGTKTWSRYEAGESIRRDKLSGLCKALRWKSIPDEDEVESISRIDLNKYKNSKSWSPYLAEFFGNHAALSFVIGSDILLDEISSDIAALAEMPKGSHIGEVPSSFVSSIMPQQFLMRYDYEFMWALRKRVVHFRTIAPNTNNMLAHSVIDELVLYLILEESRYLMDEMEFDFNTNDEEDEYNDWGDWVADICGDADLEMFLYSDLLTLTPGDTYHFDDWFKQQFYISEEETGEED